MKPMTRRAKKFLNQLEGYIDIAGIELMTDKNVNFDQLICLIDLNYFRIELCSQTKGVYITRDGYWPNLLLGVEFLNGTLYHPASDCGFYLY
jgi:hypothetical protein